MNRDNLVENTFFASSSTIASTSSSNSQLNQYQSKKQQHQHQHPHQHQQHSHQVHHHNLQQSPLQVATPSQLQQHQQQNVYSNLTSFTTNTNSSNISGGSSTGGSGGAGGGGGAKLHERILINMRLQRHKNRRLQSVTSESNRSSSSGMLQKCYSADENMMTANNGSIHNNNNPTSIITSATNSSSRCYSGKGVRSLNISAGFGLSTGGRKLTAETDDNTLNSSTNSQEIILEKQAIVPHVHIKAATLEKLMEELLIHLDVKSNMQLLINEENLVFPRIFFLVHQWFSTSETIGNLLISHADFGKTEQLTSSIFGSNRRLFKMETVTLGFCLWIEFYSNDFMGPDSCMPLLTQFMEQLAENRRSDLVSTLENCLNASYDWSRGLSLRISVRRHLPSNIKLLSNSAAETGSLVFNQIHPNKIAEQLTVIEFKAFRRITIQDLKTYSITATIRDIPRLERSVYLFNGMSQWVQCMILSKTTPNERAEVLDKFLLIARHLLFLQNFNSFYAIIGGITHSTISRLSNTMALLNTSSKKMLDEFATLISSKSNFSNYRQMQREAKGFHIPVLAVHLKDLIFYNTALSDYHGKLRLINFRKFAQLASTLQCILDQQSMQMNIHQNVDLSNTLRLSLDLQYTEEEIYELSLAREPRTTNDVPTGNKNVLFAEFVSGVKPPTPEILKQHINGMVEAVFKVYDNDKDGLISSEEFDQVAENFPFIDSFAVLDADNDGVISKNEMKSYFLRANYNALKNSFKHDFFENTYFKPTFCAHCTGLLWGLIKQGWRCRECNLNVHKHCKDQVVMECRLRSSGNHVKSGTGALNASSPNNLTVMTSSISGSGTGSSITDSPIQTMDIRTNNSSNNSLEQIENPGDITIEQKRRMSQRRKLKRSADMETQTFDVIKEFHEFTYIDEETSDFMNDVKEENPEAESVNKTEFIRLKEQNELMRCKIEELMTTIKEKDGQIRIMANTMKNMRSKITAFVVDVLSIFNSQ